jgi:cellulose biosynthesis protein BcsQ
MVAATEIIVPVDMGAFSLRGTSRLLRAISNVRKLNPVLPAPRFLARRTEATKLSGATRLS